MPYRFIVTNSTDYIEANSYLNLEDANIIIESLANKGYWNEIDDENRKILLINASLGIDGLIQYQGLPTDPEQVLKFPRNGKTKIPIELEFATAKFAVRLSREQADREIKKDKSSKFEREYFKSVTNDGEIKRDPNVALFLNKYKMRTVKLTYI